MKQYITTALLHGGAVALCKNLRMSNVMLPYLESLA